MSFNIRDGQSEISGDFSKLEKLLADLGTDHFVDIGVFATAKTPDGKQVAEYVAANEFGSIERKLPVRSTIRMPLEAKQADIANYVEKKAPDHIEKGNIGAIFEDIGNAGVAKIQEAFDSRGFGMWEPDSDKTIQRKGSDAPMIDKGLARKSMTYRTNTK